ncbi:DNA repair exonuclease [Candidatus Bathyarchaeota archaeon]|nr:DNA repair exonuclease [Candidatus Bathyarchaeota archaeon]
MEPFSFVHASDLHLGYSQYGLEARRRDFDTAFQELIDKTLELKPSFMIIAGDIFHTAHPSNITLEEAVRNFSRLKAAGIPVLAVDGSHDSAPNVVTGTILNPLDTAGLIYYLPRHQGACWRKDGCCYVYGVPNFRTRRKTEEQLPKFLEQNKPMPEKDLFTIFVFHMALDIPELKVPGMEAEASEAMIPEGFNYYAAGHLHKRYTGSFKGGLLVYPGSTETVSYDEASNDKGFYYVEVSKDGEVSPQFIKLESPRKFIVLERDFTGLSPAKITELAVELVMEADQEGAIIVPVLKGVLPAESSRSEVDVARIREAANKALLVRPLVMLREKAVSEAVVRSIFESEFKDLKSKSFEYFLQIFSERYSSGEAEKIARVAVNLIEPLTRKKEEEIKRLLEELTP